MCDLEMQKYLFDLQGYLVIEDALNSNEISRLNSLIDLKGLPAPGKFMRFGSAPYKSKLEEIVNALKRDEYRELQEKGVVEAKKNYQGTLSNYQLTEPQSGFLQWGKPFCDLLDHPQIMPILQFILGDCFRLDRLYGINMQEGMGGGELHADYGPMRPPICSLPGKIFHPPNTEITQGFTVVAWNLSDTGPDTGGFCCIPGSHKSNLRVPEKILVKRTEASCVVIPAAPAGSVTLFSEALVHGTAPWRGKHHRRSLLYKYCVSNTAWMPGRVKPPGNVELTNRQKIFFLPPADPHRHFPSLFEGLEDKEEV